MALFSGIITRHPMADATDSHMNGQHTEGMAQHTPWLLKMLRCGDPSTKCSRPGSRQSCLPSQFVSVRDWVGRPSALRGTEMASTARKRPLTQIDRSRDLLIPVAIPAHTRDIRRGGLIRRYEAFALLAAPAAVHEIATGNAVLARPKHSGN